MDQIFTITKIIQARAQIKAFGVNFFENILMRSVKVTQGQKVRMKVKLGKIFIFIEIRFSLIKKIRKEIMNKKCSLIKNAFENCSGKIHTDDHSLKVTSFFA